MGRVLGFFVSSRLRSSEGAWRAEEAARALETSWPTGRGHWYHQRVGSLLWGALLDSKINEPELPGAETFVVVAGDLVGNVSEVRRDPDLARSIFEGKRNSDQWDGAFALAAIDPHRSRATLVTDRFGLFPLYRFESSDAVHLATSLEALRALVELPRAVDLRSVYEMVSLGMILGNRTFLNGVHLVPPATLIHLEDGIRSTERYWGWQGLEPSAQGPGPITPEAVHETYRLIEQAVLKSIPPGASRLGVPLSGGLDSRMICAVLARNDIPFHAYTVDTGREAELAQKVAEVLGAPLSVFPPFRDGARSVPEAMRVTDDSYRAEQTWGWELAESLVADGRDVLLDGLAFGAVLGATLRSPGDSPSNLARALNSTYNDTYPKEMARAFGASLAKEIDESVHASLVDAAREAIEQAGPLASEYYLMNNRIRRYTFGYCLSNLWHLPCAYPYVARELFEHCMRLPTAYRTESRLYRMIYRELFPELVPIPWAKTGVPLDQYATPKRSRFLGLFEAALLRASLGRVGLPNRVTFVDKFRVDNGLRQALRMRHEVLALSDEGILAPKALDRAVRLYTRRQIRYGLLLGLYSVHSFLDRALRGSGPVQVVGQNSTLVSPKEM